MKEQPDPSPLSHRIGWFIAIWILGVLSLGAVSYLLRFFFNIFYT